MLNSLDLSCFMSNGVIQQPKNVKMFPVLSKMTYVDAVLLYFCYLRHLDYSPCYCKIIFDWGLHEIKMYSYSDEIILLLEKAVIMFKQGIKLYPDSYPNNACSHSHLLTFSCLIPLKFLTLLSLLRSWSFWMLIAECNLVF